MNLKILYIGVYQRYIANTIGLLPAVLQKFSTVYFYGPGYVDTKALDEGVEKYADKLRDIDFIVINAQCLVNKDSEAFGKYLNRYTAVFNSGNIGTKFLSDVEYFCKKNKAKVISTVLDIDPHVTRQYTLDKLIESSEYFMGWGDGFLNSKSYLNSFPHEKFIQEKLKIGRQVGLFDDFARNFATKFINLGHFVNDSEFYWGNLSSRKYDVAVPGSGYGRRKGVLATLKHSDNIRVAWNKYKYLFKISDRLGFGPYSNFYLVNLYNLFFQQEMSQTKICITEGGGNNYPVRKFLEVPASGALMICWPAFGLERLGFTDGVNSIFINDDLGIVKLIETIIKDVDKFEAIASSGRELVNRKHSSSARVQQLSEAFQKIHNGSFQGSYWEAGEFICK